MATNTLTASGAPKRLPLKDKPKAPNAIALLRKINVYYVLAALMIIWAARITPLCIYLALQSRGYSGYGGEYLVLPMGIMVGIVMISLGRDLSRRRKRRQLAEYELESEEVSQDEGCNDRQHEAC